MGIGELSRKSAKILNSILWYHLHLETTVYNMTKTLSPFEYFITWETILWGGI